MSLLSAFGYGIMCGLGLTFMIGPVFFALIQTSIEKGVRSGITMAFGIALSDAIYMTIASLGVAVLASSPSFQAWLGLIGGFILLAFGISNIQKKVKEPKQVLDQAPSNQLFTQLAKGFLLNGINPFVLLFWFGIGVVVVNYSLQQKALFFGGSLLTVLLTDILKAYGANKVSHWLTPKFLLRMNKLVGAALMIFSIKLFYFAYETFKM